jgi:hypothetical protein
MNGWKLVPVEPTAGMLAAGVAAESNAPTHVQERLTLYAYRAMLAAAPTPPAEAVTCSNAALQAFQRFADYDAKTDCYVVQADDLRPAIDAALAAKEQP